MDQPSANIPENPPPEHPAQVRGKLAPLAIIALALAVISQILGFGMSFIRTLIFTQHHLDLASIASGLSIIWSLFAIVFGIICLSLGLVAAMKNKKHLPSFTMGVIAATVGAQYLLSLFHTVANLLGTFVGTQVL